jgi:hypothetical protein
MIRAGTRLPPDERAELASTLLSAYAYLMDIAGFQTGSSVVPKAVMARARADLGGFPGLVNSLDARDSLAALYGSHAAPLHADYWASAAGDTSHPARGRYALVFFNVSRDMMPALRRLAARGVDVTLVRGMRGHFRGQGPLDADAEARALQTYYLQELALPGTLALVVSQYDHLPDGRRVRRANASQRSYQVRQGAQGVLVDPQGIIRYIVTHWRSWTELDIEAAMR